MVFKQAGYAKLSVLIFCCCQIIPVTGWFPVKIVKSAGW